MLVVGSLVWTAVQALAGCTPYVKPGEPPVAVAGQDLVLAGASVVVDLNGSASTDPDGEIVAYEWRFTGWPATFVPPPAADGGVMPTDPTLDPMAPSPPFCPNTEGQPDDRSPIRYCLLAAQAQTSVTLTPGGYRFTLYVTDDDDLVSADTLEVTVTP
jgi:hypothetical protein